MVAEDVTAKFIETMIQMEKPDSEFLCADFSGANFCLQLSYSRKAFIKDVEKILSKLSEQEQVNITSLFGFILKKTEQCTTIIGYPSVCNLSKDGTIEYKKLYNTVTKFITENSVTVKNCPEFSKNLNTIIETFPEFLTTVGKIQHHTHSYTVDVHTLKVLQGVIKNHEYKELIAEDRLALQVAVLLHDITKKEGEIDKSHPVCSAKDASFILNKTSLSSTLKNKICLLIRNHDWLERYNKGITKAVEFADILKEGSVFKMLCILAEADLKAVQKDGAFYLRYKDVLMQGAKEITELILNAKSAA